MIQTLTDLIRTVSIAAGGLILGIAFHVFLLYWKKAKQLGNEKKHLLPAHVRDVALSYCLLICVTAGTQFVYILERQEPTWRIFLITPAYILGLLALTKILRLIADRDNTPKRRTTDPPLKDGAAS